MKHKKTYRTDRKKSILRDTTTRYLVSQKRNYGVINVAQARGIALTWIQQMNLENTVGFGLPEIDDRYHIWRVPLKSSSTKEKIGEVVIDARTSLIVEEKSTKQELLEARLLGRKETAQKYTVRTKEEYPVSPLRNTIAYGDSETILHDLPANSIDLVFTSPPYYNVRPEYTEYTTYEDYLSKMRAIVKCVHRVLNEGRFFTINVSPVLIRRANRKDCGTL